MAKLTVQELTDLAQSRLRSLDVGNKDMVYTMVAIALAESGGDPKAKHVNANGTTDYGLWQINSVHDGDLWPKGGLKPDGTIDYGPRQASIYDPEENAKLAATLFARRGNKWTDWSVYKSGAYKKFLPQAQGADVDVSLGTAFREGTFGEKDSLVSGLKDSVTDPLSQGFNTLSTQFARVSNSAGAWLIAVVLFVVGIALLVAKSGAPLARKIPAVKAVKAVTG